MDKNNKMPKLFEVKIVDKDEVKSTEFIAMLQEKGFIDHNEIYFNNYINADIGIVFSHIKNCYKQYVIEGNWTEDKFEDVIYIIAKHRKMLIPNVFLKYGIMHDEGKLTKEAQMERKRYTGRIIKDKNKDNEVSKEEQELLDYIAKHGGRR